jgi:hypothetical protein
MTSGNSALNEAISMAANGDRGAERTRNDDDD